MYDTCPHLSRYFAFINVWFIVTNKPCEAGSILCHVLCTMVTLITDLNQKHQNKILNVIVGYILHVCTLRPQRTNECIYIQTTNLFSPIKKTTANASVQRTKQHQSIEKQICLKPRYVDCAQLMAT